MISPLFPRGPIASDGAGAEQWWRHTIGAADAATIPEACRRNRTATKPGGRPQAVGAQPLSKECAK